MDSPYTNESTTLPDIPGLNKQSKLEKRNKTGKQIEIYFLARNAAG